MKRIFVLIVMVSAICLFGENREFAKLRDSREKLVKAKNDKYETLVKKLDKEYLKKLEELKLKVMKNGDLPGAIEVDKEIASYKKRHIENRKVASTPSGKPNINERPNTTKITTRQNSVESNCMAGYKLYELDDRLKKNELIGKSYIITGILSDIIESRTKFRLDMFDNKVTCHMKDPNCQYLLALKEFNSKQKRAYSNRRSDYYYHYIKFAVKGTVARSIKADSVNLVDCEIVFWNGYIVRGTTSRLYFSPSSKGDNINFRNIKCSLSGDNFEIVQGDVEKSSKRMKRLEININKKLNICMGNDPLAFGREIIVINDILDRMKFDNCLNVMLLASKKESKTNEYENGNLLSWCPIESKIRLYSPDFKTEIFTMDYSGMSCLNFPDVKYAKVKLLTRYPQRGIRLEDDPCLKSCPEKMNKFLKTSMSSSGSIINVMSDGVVMVIKRLSGSSYSSSYSSSSVNRYATVPQLIEDGWKVCGSYYGSYSSSSSSYSNTYSSSSIYSRKYLYLVFYKKCKNGDKIHYQYGLDYAILP